MNYRERKELVRSYLGKTIEVIMDRPIGTEHPKHKGLIYPINYGYIKDVLGGDGEEQDVYILGINKPVEKATVKVIGIIHRENDVEDKLVACPVEKNYHQADIESNVYFQEKYYKYHVESIYEKSCGTVPYTLKNGELNYLLIQTPDGRATGFPKGHIEKGENEFQTAIRETKEETSICADITFGFSHTISYVMPNGKRKDVIYFPADFKNQKPSHCEGFEDSVYLILPYQKAREALTFDNTKEVLDKTNDFLLKLLKDKQ